MQATIATALVREEALHGGFGMPLNSRTHVVFIGSLWYLLSVVC